jgi:arylsulfatase
VLLISLDTLRADHCGFGGYGPDTTPFMDNLAERGVVFTQHFANSNCTLPSHASMLTGLWMPSHGVIPQSTGDEEITPIAPGVLTLAESFKRAGYETQAITSHPIWLNQAHGFDQGFDSFETSWRSAETTIDEYFARLDATPPEKSFTFLHFFDIHSDSGSEAPCLPYESSPELVAEFAGASPEGFTGCHPIRPDLCASKYLEALSWTRKPLPPGYLDFLMGLYDAGIRKLDGDLERLFKGLDQRGLLDETLIVITADHGEAFSEHLTLLHSGHHDEDARVPLLIVPPARWQIPPRRLNSATQSTDLAPTLLELCGLEPVGQTQSLARAVMLGEEPAPAPILFQGHILIDADESSAYKYIRISDEVPPVFFDRSADPGETHNLMVDEAFQRESAQRLERIGHQLDRIIGECEQIRAALGGGQDGAGELSEAERAQLLNLGYLGEEP